MDLVESPIGRHAARSRELCRPLCHQSDHVPRRRATIHGYMSFCSFRLIGRGNSKNVVHATLETGR